MLLPLALAQFVSSFACSSMNVAISSIAADLGITVQDVQLTISLFTLVMAALMIPGSKLTDIWGRKLCFVVGTILHLVGGLIAALAPNLTVLILGYSILEGIGSALLIPPIYIFITVSLSDQRARARAFGIVSAMAGVGAAAGPLIGGIVTSAISWRASFALQILLLGAILILGRRIIDPGVKGPKPGFDLLGAFTSALGLIFVVLGILQAANYGWFTARKDFAIGDTVLIHQGGISPVWIFVGIGALILVFFFIHIRSRERRGKTPLVSIRMFKNRTSNLGLVTQNIQWLILQGSFFVISVFLQQIRELSAVETGLVLTASTVGILISSGLSGRLAKKYARRTLIVAGFVITAVGMVVLLLLSDATSSIFLFLPGLFLMGIGIGAMLTFSVDVVQSSFPEKDQGEISGLSRSVSNLGSSLGVAIVGSVLFSTAVAATSRTYGYALITMLAISLVGLVAAILLPKTPVVPDSAVSKAPG